MNAIFFLFATFTLILTIGLIFSPYPLSFTTNAGYLPTKCANNSLIIECTNELNKTNITLSGDNFLMARENWPFVHLFLPFLTDLLITKNWLATWFVITIWEVFELLAYVFLTFVMSGTGSGNTLVSWFRESNMDSLVGDLIMGTLGILLSIQIRKTLSTQNKHVFSLSGRFKTIILWITFALSNLLSAVLIKLDAAILIPGFLSATGNKHLIGVFPLGHCLFFPVGLIVLHLLWYTENDIASYLTSDDTDGFPLTTMKNDVNDKYYWIFMFYSTAWTSTFFFIWLTYPSVIFFYFMFLCFFLFSIAKNKNIVKKEKFF